MKNTSFFVIGTLFGGLCVLIVPAAFVGGYMFRDQMITTTIYHPATATPQPKIGGPTRLLNPLRDDGYYDYSISPEYDVTAPNLEQH